MLALVDPLGFRGGRKLGLDLFDVYLLRHGEGGQAAVAREDGEVLEAKMLELVDDVLRLGPHAVARTERADDLSFNGHQESGLAGLIERLERRGDLGWDLDSALTEESKVADEHRASSFNSSRNPGPGLGQEVESRR